MTMRITLPAELEAFIQEKVEVGRYKTASDAVTEGLRLLKERDAAEFESLRATLHDRLAEAKRGRSVPFDSGVRDGIRRRGMKQLAALKAKQG